MENTFCSVGFNSKDCTHTPCPEPWHAKGMGVDRKGLVDQWSRSLQIAGQSRHIIAESRRSVGGVWAETEPESDPTQTVVVAAG